MNVLRVKPRLRFSKNIRDFLNWVVLCGPLSFTLFMTSKIFDFPFPIYDLTKSLILYNYTTWPFTQYHS